MAGSVNKAILVGNLGRDPEIRSTQDGRRVATMSIATSESWRDKSSGERKEKTEWHRITVFNEHLVEVVEKYARKGSKLFLEGQLQTRKWTDQQGVERYTTEIVLANFRGELQLLDKAEGGGTRPPPADSQDDYGQTTTRSSGGPGYGARHDNPGATGRPSSGAGSGLDDEIPF